MTTEQKIIRAKVGLLELAKQPAGTNLSTKKSAVSLPHHQ